jgi:hypothetical protein
MYTYWTIKSLYSLAHLKISVKPYNIFSLLKTYTQ